MGCCCGATAAGPGWTDCWWMVRCCVTMSQVGMFSGVEYSHPSTEHDCRGGGAITVRTVRVESYLLDITLKGTSTGVESLKWKSAG